MTEDFLICKKEEAYSYDELGFIKQTLQNENCKKMNLMQNALAEDKENSAVFFMPKESFDIFSMLQGDSSICDFSLEDIEIILDSVKNYSGVLGKPQNDYKGTLISKLEVLKKFLSDGNQVKPIVIPVDIFEKL